MEEGSISQALQCRLFNEETVVNQKIKKCLKHQNRIYKHIKKLVRDQLHPTKEIMSTFRQWDDAYWNSFVRWVSTDPSNSRNAETKKKSLFPMSSTFWAWKRWGFSEFRKRTFCQHLLNFLLFQTCMTFVVLWNTMRDVLMIGSLKHLSLCSTKQLKIFFQTIKIKLWPQALSPKQAL